MVKQDGRSPASQGRAATPSGPSPSVSGIAGIPNAEGYTTVVVRHRDEDAARTFIKDAHRQWPFMDNAAPSQMTFISVGDSASVLDAVRMALVCEEIGADERIELALDLEANCFTWAECLAFASSEWELAHANGVFVDASGIEAATADETALAGSAEGESPVAKPDAQASAPTPQRHPGERP